MLEKTKMWADNQMVKIAKGTGASNQEIAIALFIL